MRDVAVYALLDPRDGAARYVGRSVNPGARLMGHLGEAKWGTWRRRDGLVVRNAKDVWLWEVTEAGLRPELLVLDEVSGPEAEAVEQAWIDACLASGDRLLNVRDARGVPLVREVACA